MGRVDRERREHREQPCGEHLTEPVALRAFIDAALREYGRIDVLVTNAGGPKTGRFVDLQAADWDGAVQLLLMSAVHALEQVVPVMRAQHSGSIVLLYAWMARKAATARSGCITHPVSEP